MCRALAYVAVAGHDGHLASDHDVRGALDAVHEAFTATVEVVELALGDGVVDVDSTEHAGASRAHFLQAMHARGGLFGDAEDFRALAAVPGGINRKLGLDGGVQAGLFFALRVGQNALVLLGLLAEVHEQRGVTAVVENHVRAFARGALGTKLEDTVRVVPIVRQRFALVGKHRRAGSHEGSRSVVLRGEDVAGSPAHFGAQCLQRLDEHGGLDGHVQRTGNARAFQRLRGHVFLADSHEARHFGFSNVHFLAAPGGKGEVGNSVVFRRAELGVHQSVLEIRV